MQGGGKGVPCEGFLPMTIELPGQKKPEKILEAGDASFVPCVIPTGAQTPFSPSSVSLQGSKVLGVSLLLGNPGTLPPSSKRIRGFPPLLLFGIQGPRFGNEWETRSSGH